VPFPQTCGVTYHDISGHFYLHIPQVPPSFLQCLQYLQFLQALQTLEPVQVADNVLALPIFAAIIIRVKATNVALKIERFIEGYSTQDTAKYRVMQ
jgi:hypothetical protein